METIHLLLVLCVFVLVAGVCWYVLNLLISSFPLPQPFANIIRAIFALVLLLAFLGYVLGGNGLGHGWGF